MAQDLLADDGACTASGDSEAKKFLDHYMDELKDQFRGGSSTKK